MFIVPPLPAFFVGFAVIRKGGGFDNPFCYFLEFATFLCRVSKVIFLGSQNKEEHATSEREDIVKFDYMEK